MMEAQALILAAAMFVHPACGQQPDSAPPVEPQGERTCVLQLVEVDWVEIHGETFLASEQKEIRLRPGEYEFHVGKEMPVSFMRNPAMKEPWEATMTVALTPGKSLSLYGQRAAKKDIYFWAENSDTGTVVAGYKTPSRAIKDLRSRVGDPLRPLTIYEAAQLGEVEIVEARLAEGVNPDESDYRGGTALMHAAAEGHENVVRHMISAGGNVNHRNETEYRSTTLMVAASAGLVDVTRALLESDEIDVNLEDTYGWTALMYAAKWGETEVVNLLLSDPRLDVNAQDLEGQTAWDVAKKRSVKKAIAQAGGLSGTSKGVN